MRSIKKALPTFHTVNTAIKPAGPTTPHINPQIKKKPAQLPLRPLQPNRFVPPRGQKQVFLYVLAFQPYPSSHSSNSIPPPSPNRPTNFSNSFPQTQLRNNLPPHSPQTPTLRLFPRSPQTQQTRLKILPLQRLQHPRPARPLLHHPWSHGQGPSNEPESPETAHQENDD